ncbi:hypothetical protein JMM61_17565 [Rhodovulum sulfidophilum]|uniref:hypothetical protein n=1 Tax=Rhodovulum sulfidophilum TaxID=35806 RepID=UPI001928D2BB|nr:hypothetical protein [Rhodovulum sulfidophilum]MBL3587167.1 hypothetical protein [Rhodovulum sulfidophilum]
MNDGEAQIANIGQADLVANIAQVAVSLGSAAEQRNSEDPVKHEIFMTLCDAQAKLPHAYHFENPQGGHETASS